FHQSWPSTSATRHRRAVALVSSNLPPSSRVAIDVASVAVGMVCWLRFNGQLGCCSRVTVVLLLLLIGVDIGSSRERCCFYGSWFLRTVLGRNPARFREPREFFGELGTDLWVNPSLFGPCASNE
ncbi:hypothetical protein Tsubulata_009892, partial [Turnera subulata]